MGWDIFETETDFEPERPESAEEAYAALVNGVMNHGAKTVTALSLGEEPKGKTGIYRQAVEEAGHNSDADHKFIPSRSTIEDYLKESLIDIGMVGSETITEAQHPTMEGGSAYRASEFGRHMQPILAYSIKATSEADHLEELEEALGPTYSSGEGRSPMRRSQILHSIRHGARNSNSIADEHGLEGSQVDNLTTRLDEEGVVDKINIYLEGGNFVELDEDASEDDVDTVSTYASKTEDIVEYLSGREEPVNSSEIIEEFGTDSSTRQVIAGLKDQGVINEAPTLELTEKGEEALEILDNTATAVSQYMSSDAETLTEALEAMPDYVSDVWEEYQEDTERFREEYNMDIWNTSRLNSSKVNSLAPEEAQHRVEEIVGEYDEPVTIHEVADEWENQYEDRRTKKAIKKYMRDSDKISNERADEGYQVMWQLEE